jgi:predicted permease
MNRRPRSGAARSHAWLLQRALPTLDPHDIDDATADFDRLRADAWSESVLAWLRVWARELRALVTTVTDERRRARAAQIDDRSRGARLVNGLAAWRYDLRQAARGLVRDRVLASFVVLALAVGVGANATTLGLVDRVLVRGPEQVRDPDRLIRLYRRISKPPAGEQTSPWLPYETYIHVRDGMHAFDAIGAYGVRATTVGQGPSARLLRVGMTLGALFPVLGTQPIRGRFFSAHEDAGSAGPLVVVSDALWRSDFGGDPMALGHALFVEGQPYTIVGVAPPRFTGPGLAKVDAWILGNTTTAASYNWTVVGHLRPGTSAATASAEAAAVHMRTSDDEPRWIGEASLLAAPIRYDDTARESTQSQIAKWMTGVSLLILLTTCANVVNLLLVRLARRQRELGIRVALGSGRGRVMRLVALEGVLLSLVGGAASLWVASAFGPLAQRALFPDAPTWIWSPADPRQIMTVGLLVLIPALLIGLVPAWQAGGPGLNAALRERAGTGVGHSRLRASLTVVQAALSVVLLAGAGLFLRSLAQVSTVDLGSEPDRVVVAEARLDRPPVPADRAAFAAYLDGVSLRERGLYRRAVDVVRRVPGVERASITLGLPFNGGFTSSLTVPGLDTVPALPGGGPYVSAVARDYFTTMGTRLISGRAFEDRDREATAPVAIVGQTTAARLWAGRDAIGACLRIGTATAPCARVVGVVQDVHRVSLNEEPSLQVYVPFGQERGFAGARLVVRPVANGALSWPALRQAMLAVDPAIRLVDLHELSESLGAEMQPLRLGMATFGAGAVLAVLASALGLYSVMSYTVAWRRREIGIRLALGANGAQVRRLIVGNSMILAATGVVIGLGLTLVGGQWIGPQLFRTSASDPKVLATVSGILLVVACAAGLIPAQRAVQIPPTESLRTD